MNTRALLAAVLALAPLGAGAQELRGTMPGDESDDLLRRTPLAARSTALENKEPAKADPNERPERRALESDEDIAEADAALFSGESAETAFDERTPVVIEAAPDPARASRSEAELRARREAERGEAVIEPVGAAKPATDPDRLLAGRIEAENGRVTAIESTGSTPETEPFAAPGLRAGTFLLRPSLEQGIAWTSNAAGGAGSAFFSSTTLRLDATSDWSRHAASLSAYGTWLQPISGGADPEPEAGVDASLAFDLGGDWAARGALAFEFSREDASSAVPLPPTASRPLRMGLDASVGLAKDAGKSRLAATLALSRAAYGDAKLSGGGTLSQEERNSTLLTATLRAGYEVSPSLVPFVEISGGRRFMDLATDAAGYDRSAWRLALRGGLEIDRGEKLRGEVSVGWLRESFDDSRLAALSGLSVDGTLTWSPVRETTMTLRGTTSVEGTTTAGNSGSLLHSAEARVARAIRENLTGEIAAGVSLRDYAGSSDLDIIASGTASLTWWLNRYAGITGRVRYEQVSSTLAGMDSRTGSAFLGLTLRR